MAAALPASRVTSPTETLGSVRLGRPAGTWPTIDTPRPPAPTRAPSTLKTTTARSAAGSLGRTRSMTSIETTTPRESMAEVAFT